MAKLVDAQFVKDRLNDGKTVIVNVLSPGDYERSHIPGSINAPVEQPGFDERIESAVPNKQQPVVVHCSSLDCQASTKAAKRMEGLGYTQVYEFKAGIQGWKDAGGRLESTPRSERPERPERTERRRVRAEPAEEPAQR